MVLAVIAKQLTMECKVLFLLISLVVGGTQGEVIKFDKCYVSAKRGASCTVHEVRLSPCPEAADNKPCRIRLTDNVTLSFDYTPLFSSSRLGVQAFKQGSFLDVPFEGMDVNGCHFTPCPLEANKQQTFNFPMKSEANLPSSIAKNQVYNSKVKLWNEDDFHQQCCFKLRFELID